MIYDKFFKSEKFMKTFGQEVLESPKFPNKKIIQLRINLIKEELNELEEAVENDDLLEVADALTDICMLHMEQDMLWNKLRRLF